MIHTPWSRRQALRTDSRSTASGEGVEAHSGSTLGDAPVSSELLRSVAQPPWSTAWSFARSDRHATCPLLGPLLRGREVHPRQRSDQLPDRPTDHSGRSFDVSVRALLPGCSTARSVARPAATSTVGSPATARRSTATAPGPPIEPATGFAPRPESPSDAGAAVSGPAHRPLTACGCCRTGPAKTRSPGTGGRPLPARPEQPVTW